MIETIIGLTVLAGVKYAGYCLFQSIRQDKALFDAAKLQRKIEPLAPEYAVKRPSRHYSDMTEINELLDSIANKPSDYNASGKLFNKEDHSTHQRIIKKSSKNRSKVLAHLSLPPPPRRKK